MFWSSDCNFDLLGFSWGHPRGLHVVSGATILGSQEVPTGTILGPKEVPTRSRREPFQVSKRSRRGPLNALKGSCGLPTFFSLKIQVIFFFFFWCFFKANLSSFSYGFLNTKNAFLRGETVFFCLPKVVQIWAQNLLKIRVKFSWFFIFSWFTILFFGNCNFSGGRNGDHVPSF